MKQKEYDQKFQKYDADGSGGIDQEELFEFMSEMVAPLKPEPADIDFIYHECHFDKDQPIMRGSMPVLMPILVEWSILHKAAAVAAEMVQLARELDTAVGTKPHEFVKKKPEKSSMCSVL